MKIGYDKRKRPVYEIHGKAMVLLRPGVYRHVGSEVMHYECQDCKGNPEAPMLRDSIWDHLGITGVVCTACLERRMKRPITSEDLTKCPLNDDWLLRGHPPKESALAIAALESYDRKG